MNHDTTAPVIRTADSGDLDAINKVIESAVMQWQLPERVKRLALPGYVYKPMDLDHMHVFVCETPRDGIVGVAACESAEAAHESSDERALLLHGLYVAPGSQRLGVGRRLFTKVETFMKDHGYNGLLVKAHSGSQDFFLAQGMVKLPCPSDDREYEHRYWKPVY